MGQLLAIYKKQLFIAPKVRNSIRRKGGQVVYSSFLVYTLRLFDQYRQHVFSSIATEESRTTDCLFIHKTLIFLCNLWCVAPSENCSDKKEIQPIPKLLIVYLWHNVELCSENCVLLDIYMVGSKYDNIGIINMLGIVVSSF